MSGDEVNMKTNAQRMFWAIVVEGALLTTAGGACSSGNDASTDEAVDSGQVDPEEDTDSDEDTEEDTDSDEDTDTDSDTDTDTDSGTNDSECPADCNALDHWGSSEDDWSSCYLPSDASTSQTCCWTSGECCDLCCENW